MNMLIPQPYKPNYNNNIQNVPVFNEAPVELASENPIQGLSDILSHNKGVMIGDNHGDNRIINFMQENISNFRQQGISKLFIEMIASEDQNKIDELLEKGDKSALINYFNDNGWGKSENWTENLSNFILEAYNQGISIKGIDTNETNDIDLTHRLSVSNPHWASIVRSNTQDMNDSERFIVFGGAGHSADFSANQGVDKLLGIPSVDFVDVNLDSSSPQPFRILPSENPRESDFEIRMP
jgi:hypothetical protein